LLIIAIESIITSLIDIKLIKLRMFLLVGMGRNGLIVLLKT